MKQPCLKEALHALVSTYIGLISVITGTTSMHLVVKPRPTYLSLQYSPHSSPLPVIVLNYARISPTFQIFRLSWASSNPQPLLSWSLQLLTLLTYLGVETPCDSW